MNAPDKITLSLKDNPDVAAAFAGASAGDCITLTIEACIDEISEDLVVASIDEAKDIKVTESDDDSETENTDSEDASSDIGAQNVLAVMAPKSK